MLIYLLSLFLLLVYLVLNAINPFVCLIYLVLVFINASLLTIFIGLEYLALVILLVYVGALAILFLFVIMLMDIKASLLSTYITKPNLIVVIPFVLLSLSFLFSFLNIETTNLMFICKPYSVFELSLLENLNLYLFLFYNELLIIASLILTVSLLGSLAIII
jgi:NADH:ubiquinone oxidoreductase subunit 6 (subunit J)